MPDSRTRRLARVVTLATCLGACASAPPTARQPPAGAPPIDRRALEARLDDARVDYRAVAAGDTASRRPLDAGRLVALDSALAAPDAAERLRRITRLVAWADSIQRRSAPIEDRIVAGFVLAEHARLLTREALAHPTCGAARRAQDAGRSAQAGLVYGPGRLARTVTDVVVAASLLADDEVARRCAVPGNERPTP